jgi:hypothetical protein
MRRLSIELADQLTNLWECVDKNNLGPLHGLVASTSCASIAEKSQDGEIPTPSSSGLVSNSSRFQPISPRPNENDESFV